MRSNPLEVNVKQYEREAREYWRSGQVGVFDEETYAAFARATWWEASRRAVAALSTCPKCGEEMKEAGVLMACSCGHLDLDFGE